MGKVFMIIKWHLPLRTALLSILTLILSAYAVYADEGAFIRQSKLSRLPAVCNGDDRNLVSGFELSVRNETVSGSRRTSAVVHGREGDVYKWTFKGEDNPKKSKDHYLINGRLIPSKSSFSRYDSLSGIRTGAKTVAPADPGGHAKPGGRHLFGLFKNLGAISMGALLVLIADIFVILSLAASQLESPKELPEEKASALCVDNDETIDTEETKLF